MTDPRVDPPQEADELTTLHAFVGEYARHNGHADLLRERLDGSTGE
jgi:Protein of unknown function (DUF664)